MPATPHHARSPRACSSHTANSISGDDGEQGEKKRVSHIWRRRQAARYCSFPASQVIHVPHARSAGGEEGAASRFLELESPWPCTGLPASLGSRFPTPFGLQDSPEWEAVERSRELGVPPALCPARWARAGPASACAHPESLPGTSLSVQSKELRGGGFPAHCQAQC